MNDNKTWNIARLARIQGILCAMAAMRGAQITEGLSTELECASERLDEYICGLISEDVKPREGTEEADWPKAYQ